MTDQTWFAEDAVLSQEQQQPTAQAAPKTPRDQRKQRVIVVLVAAILLSVLYAAGRGAVAAWAAFQGQRAIARAEQAIRTQDVETARTELVGAEANFRRMQSQVSKLGPVGWIGGVTPFVRGHVRAVRAFADAGVIASGAGRKVADAAAQLNDPSLQQATLGAAREPLTSLQQTIAEGRLELDRAWGRVSELDDYRLVWPISTVRSELRSRLDDARTQAASAEDGLRAFVIFLGGEGPRRYLLFSQNPDELRPTGGFLGSFGVFNADDEGFRMDRFEDIGLWSGAHPGALIPADKVGPPFKFGGLPPPAMRNVNMTPDWPSSAQTAADIWAREGEQPVDGVIAVTPAFLVHVLGVTGPVQVPGYTETFGVDNVVERIDYYTHRDPNRDSNRKDIIGDLSRVVLGKMVQTPGSKWVQLGTALGKAFNGRDAIVWSKDSEVQRVLRDRRWDGILPEVSGDFWYNGEFAYTAKNGRSIKRVFDHKVEIRADGSARIETLMMLSNTAPPEPIYNDDTHAYITIYGPRGATLDVESFRPAGIEPNVAGHPAAGWFLSAAPGQTVELKVIWNAPNIVRRTADGRWAYGLWWMKLPDHTGDVVNLTVNLPSGWKWKGDGPESSYPLETDLIETWEIEGPS